jgi:pilus assembly protein CpaC
MNPSQTKKSGKKMSLTVWHGSRIIFLLFLWAGLALPGLRGEELTVVKGSSAKIAVPDGIRKIIIGSDAIMDARPEGDGRAALVVGLAEGSSELRIQRLQGPDLVYKVAVHAESQGTMDQIKELLSDVAGLEIKAVGNKIVFEGKIMMQGDLDKIKKVEAAYPGAIIDLAAFDPAEMAQNLKTAILKDLHDLGVDSVTVQVTGDSVILDGIVPSDVDMTRCLEKAKARIPNVKSLLRVQQVMLETDLQFVELDREGGSSFGENLFDNNIVLAPSFSAGNRGLPGLNLSATATYKINTALTANNCKSIYQEHISGASGQELAFKQGGTVYVAGFVPIPYGVVIKVKPTLLGNDRILSDVSVEITTALPSPGQVTTREFKTATSVMSKVGETVVLSGFAQALGTGNSDKTPILGDIPLLNLLFSSKSKSKSHKEAVLLLTPRPACSPQAATGPAYSTQSKNILNTVH